MQINSSSAQSYQPAAPNGFARARQSFESLGTALDAGNLSDAKDALAQLQKDAPPQGGRGDNPLSAKIEALSKAVDSGDLTTAQQTFADIKKAVSQGPPRGGRPGGPGAGGPPPSGAHAGGRSPGGAKQPSGASGSSNANKTYDKMDSNKDGSVSELEKIAYTTAHPDDQPASTGGAGNQSGSGLNLTA